jgi:hypothetical protein
LPVPGYQNYEASDRGRIRSVRTHVLNPQKVTVMKGNRVMQEHGGKRYPTYFAAHIREKKVMVHRMVAAAFCGKEIPNEFRVHHKDNDPTHNDPRNLEVVTHSQNIERSYQEGEHNLRCKLSAEETSEVAEKYRSGRFLVRDLAREYKISKQAIHRILTDAGCTITLFHLPLAIREEIRAKYVPYKVPMRQLAEEYGVAENTIKAIVDKSYPMEGKQIPFRTASHPRKLSQKEKRLREVAARDYKIMLPDGPDPEHDPSVLANFRARQPNHPREGMGLVEIATNQK